MSAADRGKGLGNALLADAGAASAAALGIALASWIGVGELMVGGVLAYVAYRVIRHGITPARALFEGVEVGQGQPPKQAAHVAG